MRQFAGARSSSLGRKLTGSAALCDDQSQAMTLRQPGTGAAGPSSASGGPKVAGGGVGVSVEGLVWFPGWHQ